ncbi:hypothetical protein MKZ21_23100 [Paenibacillus sp. FSL P2-0536]|uniref:hypothetical protein n=1 Tax=Paenibacillus sp. FSL P2-0536 TaxID=2921629 RepID=UPI0030FAEDF1
MPITNIYLSPFPSVGIGEMLFLSIFPYLIFDLKGRKFRGSSYWVFFIYAIFITLIVSFFQADSNASDIIFKLLRDSVYVCIFLLFGQFYFNVNYAIKIYSKIVLLVSSYLFLQVISFRIFNFTLPWIIKFLPINYVGLSSNEYISKYVGMYYHQFRPTSIFLEPAHFAQYVIPCLILFLFPYKKNEVIKLKSALYVSIALLFSSSAIGIILMLVTWSIWFLKNGVDSKNIGYKFFLILSFAVAIGVCFYLYQSGNEYVRVLSRIGEINLNAEDQSSGNIRVLRGFNIWSQFPELFKILGIGFGNYETFVVNNSINTFLYNVNGASDYMSTISDILVYSGVLGAILFLRFMMKSFLVGSFTCKSLIIIMLLMFFASSLYSSPLYAICMSFILYLPFENKQENMNIVGSGVRESESKLCNIKL